MKEKMGLAEKTIDNITIKDEAYRVDVLSDQIKKISKNIMKLIHSTNGIVYILFFYFQQLSYIDPSPLVIAETGDSLGNRMTDGHVVFRDDEQRTLLCMFLFKDTLEDSYIYGISGLFGKSK